MAQRCQLVHFGQIVVRKVELFQRSEPLNAREAGDRIVTEHEHPETAQARQLNCHCIECVVFRADLKVSLKLPALRRELASWRLTKLSTPAKLEISLCPAKWHVMSSAAF